MVSLKSHDQVERRAELVAIPGGKLALSRGNAGVGDLARRGRARR